MKQRVFNAGGRRTACSPRRTNSKVTSGSTSFVTSALDARRERHRFARSELSPSGRTETRVPKTIRLNWCPGRDSNSHALRRRPLQTVCLPVPPPGRDRERLRSTAPEILQGCFFDGPAGFAGGICVFCAGIAAPPIAGGGPACPVGALGC